MHARLSPSIWRCQARLDAFDRASRMSLRREELEACGRWRDGEWLPFPALDRVPYRKLVNAISRMAALAL